MKKNIVALAAFLIAAPLVQASSLDILRENFTKASIRGYAPEGAITREFIEVSDFGRANDVLLLQLYMSVKLPDDEVTRLIGLFDSKEGCFRDIDYNDRTRGRWNPTLHLTRLYSIAKLYKDPESPWKGDSRLGEMLHKGIQFWCRKDPKSDNWWHNEIGVQKKLAAIMIMTRAELCEEEISSALPILNRSKFGRTGQNKVWLAGNNLMKGLLLDEEGLVEKAREQITQEIRVTTSEGIQPDWAFHQHGPQIQFGNYGLTYAESISFWASVLDGTQYAFSGEQCAIISNMMKEGICWSVWHGYMDPSFCGRQNFIDGNRGKAFSLAVAEQNMASTGTEGRKSFEAMALENLQPEKYANTLVGARYYDSSDCGIFRTGGWYASIRMHSTRTEGFEFTNRENTLGNFSADGALLLLKDGDEYANIFGHWDWRKVPGTTTYEDGLPMKSDNSREAKLNHSAHVGGLRLEGDVMCATMELNRDGLYALKSAFFFKDLVVNLGAGIRSSRKEISRITTSLDQNNLKGEAITGKRWALHRSTGYVSLDGNSLKVEDGLQEGLWDPIDPFYVNKKSEGRVFKCWIEHSPTAKSAYAYAILPDADVDSVRGFASEPSVKVISNTEKIQAVEHDGCICIVFHKGGSLRWKGRKYSSEEPCLMICSGGRTVRKAIP